MTSAQQAQLIQLTIGIAEARVGALFVESTEGTDSTFELARFDYEYPAQRARLYFAMKVIGPLTLIMCMALVVFWILVNMIGLRSEWKSEDPSP